MTGHKYDRDLAYDWTELGESAGDRPMWTVSTRTVDGGGEGVGLMPVILVARLTEDETEFRIRRLRYDAADDRLEDVVTVYRRHDATYDDILEPEIDTLRRWLRQQYRPMTFLVPHEWIGP